MNTLQIIGGIIAAVSFLINLFTDYEYDAYVSWGTKIGVALLVIGLILSYNDFYTM